MPAKSLLIGAAAVAVVGLVVWKMIPPSEAILTEEIPVVVYVCEETGDVFQGRAQAVPLENPLTGRSTLRLGLYCPKCEAWRIAPPMEALQQARQRPLCPKDRTPLEMDGPIPADAVRLDGE